MTYFELVEKYFNAWIAGGNVDESYADSENIMEWLQDRDIWTEEDELFLPGMEMDGLSDFADDIADMVKEYILNEM